MLIRPVQKIRRSLSLKLSIAVALVVLLTVGMMSVFAYVQDRRGADRRERASLQALSKDLAARIDLSLANGKILAAHLACTRDVLDFLGQGGRGAESRKTCQDWLDLQLRQTPGISSIFILSTTGDCLASTNRAFIGHNYNFRPFFQEAMAGRCVLTDWLIGLVFRTPHIDASAPVRIHGTIAGFLVTEISGGEPLLRRDLPEIMELFDRLGFLYTVATNGTLIDAATLGMLASARGLLQLAVSLDSLDRATYARLRGRDLLPVLLANLELVRAARLPVPVKLNMVMNRWNFRETFELLAFARERGLYLSVFPVNQGEGFAHRHADDQFQSTISERHEMAAIFRELALRRRRGEPLWEYSGFYERASDYVLGKPVGPCDAGGLYLDLNADGQIAVCPDRAGVGDLRRERLAELKTVLAAEGPAVKACQQGSPCFYTCTYNLSLTARNLGGFLRESVRVRLRRALGK